MLSTTDAPDERERLLRLYGANLADLRLRTQATITDEALLTYLIKSQGDLENAVERYRQGPWGQQDQELDLQQLSLQQQNLQEKQLGAPRVKVADGLRASAPAAAAARPPAAPSAPVATSVSTEGCTMLGVFECVVTVTIPMNASVLRESPEHFESGKAAGLRFVPAARPKSRPVPRGKTRGLTAWAAKGSEAPTAQEAEILLLREGAAATLLSSTFGSLGRLPVHVTSTLGPLVRLDLVRILAAIQPPESAELRVGGDLGLTLTVWATPKAFDADALTTKKLFRPAVQAVLRDCWEELIFRRLGLVPRRAALSMTAAETDPPPAAGTGSPGSCSDDDGSADEDGERSTAEPLESQEARTRTAAVFEGAYQLPDFDPELPEWLDTAVFSATLRKYQKQGVAWMLAQEQPDESPRTGDLEERQLHPLWNEFELMDGDGNGNGNGVAAAASAKKSFFFWFNQFSGELTLEFPHARNQNSGGILADEMGLGKTVQTIGLIGCDLLPGPNEENWLRRNSTAAAHEALAAYRKGQTATERNGSRFVVDAGSASCLFRGGTLLVVPLSLLMQWQSELERHLFPGICRVAQHIGGERVRDCLTLSQSDVVLTSYGTLVSEFKAAGFAKKQHPDEAGAEIPASARCPVYRMAWNRVVLDEAHFIKNHHTLTCRAVCSLRARSRWCLTGTPVQNSVEDLYAYLAFMKVDPWSSWHSWRRCVTVPLREERVATAVENARRIVAPLLLRRTKATKDSAGLPIVELPPRTEHLVELELDETEREFYDTIFRRAKLSFTELRSDQGLLRYTHVLEMLLRLRQAACHVMLPAAMPASVVAAAEKQPPAGNGPANPPAGGPAISAAPRDVCPICFDDPQEPCFLPCAHSLCYSCAVATLKAAAKPEALCPLCRHPFQSRQLTRGSQDLPRNENLIDAETGEFKYSTKLRALRDFLLEDLAQGRKAVVFSQWTTLLRMVGTMLDLVEIPFRQFDGSLTLDKRAEIVSWFFASLGGCVLLVSLKAGGVGLNLTCATRCYLLDHWWNVAAEDQAIQRVHRLGQTEPVEVYRLVVKRTVEQRIMELQETKAQQARALLEHQGMVAKSPAKLSLDELIKIFRDFE